MLDTSSGAELVNQLDIVKVTEVFLVPSSILVGALGVARTEGLKSGISALGFLLTVLWLICVCGAYGAASTPKPWRLTMLVFMPALFLVSWSISLRIHVKNYLNEKGTTLRHLFARSTRSIKISSEN